MILSAHQFFHISLVHQRPKLVAYIRDPHQSPKMVSIHDISQAERELGNEGILEHTFNPWFNVNNLAQPHQAQSQASDELFHTWPQFGRLPLDLVPYIAAFLPKESAAALAVTNKTMHIIIGQRVLDGLNEVEKWKLILLLERDTEIMMACSQCNKLHAPISSASNMGRSSVWGDGPRCATENMTRYVHLPRGVSPVVCRLLAKRYLRQQPYTDILSIAGKSAFLTLPDFKLSSTTSLRLVNGNLLLRNQIFIVTLTMGTKSASGRAVYAFSNLMRRETTAAGDFRCCRHLGWNDLGLEFPTGSTDENAPIRRISHKQFGKIEAFATAHREEHHTRALSWDRETHPVECYGREPVEEKAFKKALGPSMRCALLHEQPCVTCKAVGTVNLVHSCPECYTDACVSAQDVEGIGRVMVLTTWKDVGGVRKSDNGLEKWWSHCEPRFLNGRFGLGGLDSPTSIPYVAPRFNKELAGSIFSKYEENIQSRVSLPKRKIRKSKTRRLNPPAVDIMHSGYSYNVDLDRRVTGLFKRDTENEDDSYWYRSLF